MRAFSYERVSSIEAAARAAAATDGAKFIAGGTNLLDLMKLEIETPTHLVDVNGLGLDRIEATREGGLRIGALVRNTDLAADERVRRDYALLSRALLAGASGQLRNRATTAGRSASTHPLSYFYDTNQPCNKRRDRAAAVRLSLASAGSLRWLASAMPALPATRATWRSPCAPSTPSWRPCEPTARRAASRWADLHRLPGDTPHIEHVLERGEFDHRGRPAEAGWRQAESIAKFVTGPPTPLRSSPSAPSCSRMGLAASRLAVSRRNHGVTRRPKRSWRTEQRRWRQCFLPVPARRNRTPSSSRLSNAR